MTTIITDEERLQFLTELAALTRKHGISIYGCGCCCSPWLSKLEPHEAGEDHHYYLTKPEPHMAEVQWVKKEVK